MAGALSVRSPRTGGGAYTVNRTYADDETIEFSMVPTQGGADFPWSDYAIEYAINGQTLTEGNGIAVDVDANRATFTVPDNTLAAGGRYPHACRIRHLTTGKIIELFDGALTVLNGGF